MNNEQYMRVGQSETDVKTNLETRWEQKYRKWFVIGLFLIFIISAILAAIISATTGEKPGDKFTFDDIFSDEMKVKRKTVRWLDDGQDGSFTLILNNDIYIQRLPKIEPDLFVSTSDVKDEDGKKLEFFDYWISADEKFVLFGTKYQKIWRHSFYAVYYIYDTGSKVTQLLTSSKTQAAVWSPTGHTISYVVDNNVYIYNNLETTISVTTDGSDSIFNGIPPWVYEEEVFGTSHALWWSTDSRKLAFLSADESEVETFLMPIYGRSQYPEQVAIKYPKPGTANPVAKIVIYDIPSGILSSPDYGYTEEFLIVDVKWRDSTRLLARLTNRNQNIGKLFETDTSTLETKKIFERSLTNGWLEYFPIYPIPNTNYFAELLDVDGYNHIGVFDFDTLLLVKTLTSGKYEVSQISGYHPSTGRLFYVSNEVAPWERHLYSVYINSGEKTNLTAPPAYNSFSVSPKGGFFLENYNGPNVPFQVLKSTTSNDLNYVIEDNKSLQEKISTYDLPQKTFMKIPIPENGGFPAYEINAMLMLPPDFVETRRYPLLVRVYGGPASNLVHMTFSLDWHTFMAGSNEHVVAYFDGRGTAQMGNKHKFAVYKNLGEYEAHDNIEGARYLATSKFIDKNRVSIWGWSYGGYITTKVLEVGSHVYKKGVAVAPVSDWRFYDTIYTERYMLTPQENGPNYEKSAVRNYLKINQSEYFLIHGTADDNVHFQHAAVLAKDLTDSGVFFESHYYTDNNHRINTGPNTQPDLYRRITNFLQKETN